MAYWSESLWLMMFVYDVPGTEHARTMAKLAKTLQQTVSEDVSVPSFVHVTTLCHKKGSQHF